jgi:hypothetical protein
LIKVNLTTKLSYISGRINIFKNRSIAMLKKIILSTLVFGCVNSIVYGMEGTDYSKLHQAIRDYGVAEENLRDCVLGKIKKLVATYPATVTVANEFGNTSLHLASMVNGNSELVRILLDAVPDGKQRTDFVMATNDNGNTALHWALWCGDVNIAKLLIEAIPAAFRDAFVIAKNGKNKTAVHLAEENKHSDEAIEFLAYYRFASTAK